MRVRTFLRGKRGPLSLADVAGRCGMAKGDVSMFERGRWFPKDDVAVRLEAIYGARTGWYPVGVAAGLMDDLRRCPGCGEELDPSASRRRLYHNSACRSRADRSRAATKEER